MYLPISFLAYLLNGGVIVVDKILLNTSYPNPWVYTFYINILSLIILVLVPFGFHPTPQVLFPAFVSGLAATLAMLLFFKSLRTGEASISAPVVGALNPLFTFVLGAIFLNQILNPGQIAGFLIIILGAIILTFRLIYRHLRANNQLVLMVFAGFLYAVSYLFLKEVFNGTNFVTGLVLSRLFSGLPVLCFLFSKRIRIEIFTSHNKFTISPLLLFGQSLGAGAGLLLTYATALASPALVNSLFGVQYIVIFAAAVILGRKHPALLDEELSLDVLLQKIIGGAVISLGIYILSSF